MVYKVDGNPQLDSPDWSMYSNIFNGQNYRFFDNFLEILKTMKDNLGQECVKGGFYPFRAKLKQLPLISLENDSFPVLTLLSNLSLPKIWLSRAKKNYIFDMSNNRAIR